MIPTSSSGVYKLMDHLTIVNKTRCHCHSWLAGQYNHEIWLKQEHLLYNLGSLLRCKGKSALWRTFFPYMKYIWTFAYWVIFHALCVCWFFSKSTFWKINSGIQSEYQTVWIQIKLDVCRAWSGSKLFAHRVKFCKKGGNQIVSFMLTNLWLASLECEKLVINTHAKFYWIWILSTRSIFLSMQFLQEFLEHLSIFLLVKSWDS